MVTRSEVGRLPQNYPRKLIGTQEWTIRVASGTFVLMRGNEASRAVSPLELRLSAFTTKVYGHSCNMASFIPWLDHVVGI